jgi:molybdenum cofactor cytidylyltransferase
MGRSLAAGAAAAGGWDYLFVALADMPWVRPDTLERLQQEMEEAGPDTIILPVCPARRSTVRPGLTKPGGATSGLPRPGLARPGLARPGHPVGFGADYLPDLAALRGDEGARGLISKAGNRVHRVLVEDVGVLQDLDTPPR